MREAARVKYPTRRCGGRPPYAAGHFCSSRSRRVKRTAAMKPLCLLLGILALASTPGRAEELEFPLPNITGGFARYFDSVAYGGDSVSVVSVKLRLLAVIDDLGYQECWEAPPNPGYTCTLGIVFWGEVWKNEDTSRYRNAPILEQNQTGDYEKIMSLGSSTAFKTLAAGDVLHVEFPFFKNSMCCASSPFLGQDPVATITSVALIMEISPLVPVENTTWSRIKIFYRCY